MGGRGCVTSGDVTSCFSVACAAILSTWTVWIGPSFTRRPAKLRSCGPKRKHRNCGIFRQNSANLRGYARLRRGNRQVGDRSPGLSAWLVRKSTTGVSPRGTCQPWRSRRAGQPLQGWPAPNPSEARPPGARPAVGRSPPARGQGTCYCGPEGTCFRGPFDVFSRTFPQGKMLNRKGKTPPETLKPLYYVES